MKFNNINAITNAITNIEKESQLRPNFSIGFAFTSLILRSIIALFGDDVTAVDEVITVDIGFAMVDFTDGSSCEDFCCNARFVRRLFDFAGGMQYSFCREVNNAL